MLKIIAGHQGKALAKGLVPLARTGGAQVAEAHSALQKGRSPPFLLRCCSCLLLKD